MTPAVVESSPRLVPMAPEVIDKVRRLEANLKAMPQVAIRTEHLIHGGMYARTIRIPAAHGSIPALLLLPRSSALTGCSASAMRTMPRPKRSF